ncbi:ubiquitin-like modifier-activating enzyme 1 [Alosa sapidissima]|uniref:ubiquitin-like modifier-activating enzyme 1 n=1 Tax=Alosa sapidissima TaxID=34773 RepID=UPI001C0921F6|nr:ubiquitin-like modifier-activating enzyme 1 [Alosa sapidissima]
MDIDEVLYSRQLPVLGHDAMRRMGETNVLISGMRGLGVEIAKNVILAGVRSVTVQDGGVVQWYDLSSQFYLKEDDLGQNRALSCLTSLSHLNDHVAVDSHSGPLDESLLSRFQVVVLTNSSLDEQKHIGEFCHSKNIKFIVAETRGLCGQLFCDFGEEFRVIDSDGETPLTALIDSITKGNPGKVTCAEEHKCHYVTHVTFSGVQGMEELNSCGPVEVQVLDNYSFSICDTSSFSDYEKGGVATEVKKSETLTFKSLPKALDEALRDPEIMVPTDYGKVESHKTLHIAFQALHDFVKGTGNLPKPRSKVDADRLLTLARKQSEASQLENLDEGVVRKLAMCARGDLAPVNAFIGGLAAQEVIKACSGKFTPLHQWLYFDALESLPGESEEEEDEEEALTEDMCAPKGCRYDGQIAVFGSAFQEKLARQKYFLVGAGAIGCELLKNFALIGLGAGEGGNITVTDMDSIERSNLNRQFLFRSQDIGRQKAEVATRAAREMNPALNVTAHQNRLGPESEGVYGFSFFRGLDGVAAALDNVDARVYLDKLCVQHLKPMLEGGTLGTKGSTVVVVPRLTESYGPANPGTATAIPLCTLKNFPQRIEHTLQWARDQFEGIFKHTAENVNQYLSDDSFWSRLEQRGEAEALEVLEAVSGSLGDLRPQSWEDCVRWARLSWETLYNHDIRQLLHCFPPNALTSSGLPFWTGAKRCPHPLTFDPECTTHMDFVVAAANLYGQTYGIKGSRDRAAIRVTLGKVRVPEFAPKSSVKIHVSDEEMEGDKGKDVDTARLEALKAELTPSRPDRQAMKMYPLEFEKDDDSNFHMDYIVAASNLRAENYDIPTADRLKSKLIAGRIIPAIATTTAAVAGLMCLELYKLVQGHRRLQSFRVAYINLAVQMCVMSTPSKPRSFTVAGREYSLWDSFLVEGRPDGQQEMTLGGLLKHIKQTHNLEVCSLFYGPAMLYNAGSGHEHRLQQRVTEVVSSVTKEEIPPHVEVLEMVPSFVEDEDCEQIPPIKYVLISPLQE